MNADTEPQLAPPGAGLPGPELHVARMLFTLRRWIGGRDSFNARFRVEREAVRSLVSACDAESGARRVLIRRVAGLEDSSRHWSVWMALDHLRIVHVNLARVIDALTRGVKLEGAASTAAVKPDPQVTAAVRAEYERSCDALLATVTAAGNLNTAARYAHPWFGPLNAAGWHALSAGHLAIHRTQIERILQGLPRRLP
jgi:hypothetical protein